MILIRIISVKSTELKDPLILFVEFDLFADLLLVLIRYMIQIKLIPEIAEKCGFMSDSYFSKIFREIYKCTPREYRKAN